MDCRAVPRYRIEFQLDGEWNTVVDQISAIPAGSEVPDDQIPVLPEEDQPLDPNSNWFYWNRGQSSIYWENG